MEEVCRVAAGLKGSYVEILSSPSAGFSRRGLSTLAREVKSLCDEAVRRRAQVLIDRGSRPKAAYAAAGGALYEAYIKDRFELDDPFRGILVREKASGKLQGFLSRTTFTTWVDSFHWDSLHHASGLKRLKGSGRKLDEETIEEKISSKTNGGVGLDRALKRACVDAAEEEQQDSLLSSALEKESRSGDWRTTGIVWPRICEISLLASVGGAGDFLMNLCLAEIATESHYDFVVVAATQGAATFYERHGFIRVGAVARYQNNKEKKPWQGYRHWAWADERPDSLRSNHTEPSYMMARKIFRNNNKRIPHIIQQRNALLLEKQQQQHLSLAQQKKKTKLPVSSSRGDDNNNNKSTRHAKDEKALPQNNKRKRTTQDHIEKHPPLKRQPPRSCKIEDQTKSEKPLPPGKKKNKQRSPRGLSSKGLSSKEDERPPTTARVTPTPFGVQAPPMRAAAKRAIAQLSNWQGPT